MVTTIQRRVVVVDASGQLAPPRTPPISAPTAMHHSRLPHDFAGEEEKDGRGHRLTLKEMACLSDVQPRQGVVQHQAQHGQHDHAEAGPEIAAVDGRQANGQGFPEFGQAGCPTALQSRGAVRLVIQLRTGFCKASRPEANRIR